MIPSNYLFVLFVVAALSAFFYGTTVGRDHELARRAKDEAIIARVVEASQQAAATAISKIDIRQTTIRQRTEVQIRDHEIYRDCRNTDLSIGLLDAARANSAAPEPARSSVVP